MAAGGTELGVEVVENRHKKDKSREVEGLYPKPTLTQAGPALSHSRVSPAQMKASQPQATPAATTNTTISPI